MGIEVKGALSRAVQSLEAGRELGRAVAAVAPSTVLVYASVEHDQAALLRGVEEFVGDAAVVGCSTQGVMGLGAVIEGGYFAAAVGFGGDFRTGVARACEVQTSPRASGRALAQALVAQVTTPKLALLFFDPLAGVDVSELLAGFGDVLRCPIAGGAASQPWGPMATTYQYFAGEVFSHGAVAIALDGPFEVEVAASHGTESIGLETVITRVEGTQLLEFDSRPATEVWKDLLSVVQTDLSLMATLAVGIPNDGESTRALGEFRVLAPTVFNEQTGGVYVLAAVPQGTTATMHYRSVPTVLEGTRAMGLELKERLAARRVVGVLGFECGARTEPFLGRERTLTENLELQAAVASGAEWLGMMAWGEVLPLEAGPAVVNYTFPLVCLLAA